jgi:hypothetical protein
MDQHLRHDLARCGALVQPGRGQHRRARKNAYDALVGRYNKEQRKMLAAYSLGTSADGVFRRADLKIMVRVAPTRHETQNLSKACARTRSLLCGSGDQARGAFASRSEGSASFLAVAGQLDCIFYSLHIESTRGLHKDERF